MRRLALIPRMAQSAIVALALASSFAHASPDASGSAITEAVATDASQGGGYRVERHTIDSGGALSSGGLFQIQGTIGQAIADALEPATEGAFEITGGYWPGLAPAIAQPDVLFANGFE